MLEVGLKQARNYLSATEHDLETVKALIKARGRRPPGRAPDLPLLRLLALEEFLSVRATRMRAAVRRREMLLDETLSEAQDRLIADFIEHENPDLWSISIPLDVR